MLNVPSGPGPDGREPRRRVRQEAELDPRRPRRAGVRVRGPPREVRVAGEHQPLAGAPLDDPVGPGADGRAGVGHHTSRQRHEEPAAEGQVRQQRGERLVEGQDDGGVVRGGDARQRTEQLARHRGRRRRVPRAQEGGGDVRGPQRGAVGEPDAGPQTERPGQAVRAGLPPLREVRHGLAGGRGGHQCAADEAEGLARGGARRPVRVEGVRFLRAADHEHVRPGAGCRARRRRQHRHEDDRESPADGTHHAPPRSPDPAPP